MIKNVLADCHSLVMFMWKMKSFYTVPVLSENSKTPPSQTQQILGQSLLHSYVHMRLHFQVSPLGLATGSPFRGQPHK